MDFPNEGIDNMAASLTAVGKIVLFQLWADWFPSKFDAVIPNTHVYKAVLV